METKAKTKETKPTKIKVADKTTAGNEAFRVYRYPKGKGLSDVKVDLPSTIRKGPAGSHIVLNCKGQSKHVPGGFTSIEPEYRPGYENSKELEDPKV